MRITNYEWCSSEGKSDNEFLGWIFCRLQDVFGEQYTRHDYMRRLARIIDGMPGEIPAPPIQGKINEAIWSNLWPKHAPEARIAPMDIVNALDKAGLKIVEK